MNNVTKLALVAAMLSLSACGMWKGNPQYGNRTMEGRFEYGKLENCPMGHSYRGGCEIGWDNPPAMR